MGIFTKSFTMISFPLYFVICEQASFVKDMGISVMTGNI